MNYEEHLLIILAEECAEVIKAVSKALRFGLNNWHPDSETRNHRIIAYELSHVDAAAEMLEQQGLISRKCHMVAEKNCKKQRVEAFITDIKEISS